MREFFNSLRSIIKPEVKRDHFNVGEVRGVWTTAPWVKILLDVQGVEQGCRIWFMIDTGADVSVLSGSDAKTLGLYELAIATPRIEIFWLEAFSLSCLEFESSLTFTTENSEILTLRHKILTPENSGRKATPSMLGRDILRYFDLEFDPPKSEVWLRPAKTAPFELKKLNER